MARFIGPPLDATFAELTGVEDADHIRTLISKCRERFSVVGYSENTIYSGIPEVLEFLKCKPVSLAVCTSKRQDYAEKVIHMFGWKNTFRFICGGDIGIHKHQQISLLLAEGKITRETLMIGDRNVDILAAKSNGIASAGVLWGYGTRRELLDAGADMIFENPADLKHL